MNKLILYTKHDLRDYGFIKFNELYDYEILSWKGSLRIFDTKEEAENYFKLLGIKLEIKDEFWEYMKKCLIYGNEDNYFMCDYDGTVTIYPYRRSQL